jgi:hypothetical protein
LMRTLSGMESVGPIELETVRWGAQSR